MKRNRIALIALALLGCICGKSYADVSNCTGNFLEQAACIEEVEKQLLLKHPKYFQRSGSQLTLKSLHQFEEDTVLDDKAGDYGVKHKIHQFWPRHEMTMIEESAHEYWGTLLFVHKYGRLNRIPGKLTLSPSEQTFVSYNADIDAGFTENAVAIYDLNSYGIELSSKFVLKDFGVVGAEYLTENEVKLKTIFFGDDMNGYGRGECIIQKRNKVWQFKSFECTKKIEHSTK